MADTSRAWDKKPREMFYFRQRFKNRVFNRLAAFFEQEAQQRGITKKVIAERLAKDPAQITRWFSGPANLTMDTLSDLLFAMEAEPEPPEIHRLADKPKPNYVDPLIAEIVGIRLEQGVIEPSVSKLVESTDSMPVDFNMEVRNGKVLSSHPVL